MATISNDSNASVIKAPGQVWANVKQFAPDRFYSSHSIYTSERKKSLPFRIYERLSGNKGSTPVFYNYFFQRKNQ
ncbi:MAG: hypothetical protein NVV59_01555 [Chitinophagaceae bacterium]|nr:hypothetical protein [Chitinophagaceae bacterium]